MPPKVTPVKGVKKGDQAGGSGSPGPVRRSLTPTARDERATKRQVSFKEMLDDSKDARAAEAIKRAELQTKKQTEADERETKRVASATAAVHENEQEKVTIKLTKLFASRRTLQAGARGMEETLEEALDELEGIELATKLNTIKRLLELSNSDIRKKDKEIEDYLDADEIVAHIQEAMDFQQEVFMLEETLRHYMVTFYNENPESTVRPKDVLLNPTLNDDKHLGKMPLLDMPTFSGDYREYGMFMDQFDAIIGQRKCDDVTKLSHLKRALRGDARTAIFRLGVCGTDSYQRARNILAERYGNKRLIARSFITTIVGHAPVKADDGLGLRTFITTLGDATDGLGQLGVDLTTWDTILVFHVMAKLDVETQRDYNMKFPSRALADLDELVKYLTNRAVAMEDTANERPLSKRQEKKANANLLKLEKQSNEDGMSGDCHQTGGGYNAGKPPFKKFEKKPFDKAPGGGGEKFVQRCIKCQAAHALYKCHAFEQLSRPQRKEFVKKSGVCFNCLRTGHGSRECKSTYSCNVCKERHHSMLHDPDAPANGKGGKGNTNMLTLVQKVSGKAGDKLLEEEESSGPPPGFESECNLRVDLPNSNEGACEEVTAKGIGIAAVNALLFPKKSETSSAMHKTQALGAFRIPKGDLTSAARQRSHEELLEQSASANQVSGKVSADSNVASNVINYQHIDLPTILYSAPLSAVGFGRVDNGRTPILGTCNVPIAKSVSTKKVVYARALLDNCSQINFVSQSFCHRNQLVIKKTRFAISTVGCKEPQTTTGMTSFVIPLPNGHSIPVDAYLFTQVTNDMPSCEVDPDVVRTLQDYELGDCLFEQPREVDVLLGVEVYEELLLNNRMKVAGVTLTETHFGYVVTGSMKVKSRIGNANCVVGQSHDPFVGNCFSS